MPDPVWVDGTTPLNSVNMTKLQTRDEKNAANGYASLDSGVKVPLAQLPANAAGAPTITSGTTPPGSPVTGDLWYYPADATNGVVWALRYNSGSASAYKWEFVGGSPTNAVIMADEGIGGTGAWTQTTPTVGPDFTVPRNGDYRLDARARASGPNASANHVGVANASVSLNPIGSYGSGSIVANAYVQIASAPLIPGVTAGQTLRMVMNSSGASVVYGLRSLAAIPVRVS